MFRVEWLQEAVGELADIWTRADSQSRQAITEATHKLDRELQTDPLLRIVYHEMLPEFLPTRLAHQAAFERLGTDDHAAAP